MQTTLAAWQLVCAAATDRDVIDRYTAKVHTVTGDVLFASQSHYERASS